MRWLWLTCFFTTFFWLHTVTLYTRTPENYMWFIIPAILAAALGLRRAEVSRFDARWLILSLPLAVSLWLVPFPYSAGAAMLLVAGLLLACAGFSGGLAWVGMPLGLVGTVLAFQAAAFPLLYILSSRVHELPALTPLFYGIARIFHPRAALSENTLIIHYVYDVFEFPTRLESLGLIPGALFAVAGLVILAVFRRPLRVVIGFLALIAGYSVMRYMLLVFLTVRLKTASVFWMPFPLALSYLPLAIALLLIPWFGRPHRPDSMSLAWREPRQWLPAFDLVALAVLCLIGAFAFHDPGTPKQGRLLIDELHSDWEWTTDVYDTEWYGRRSGYNYYSLAEYLKLHYHVRVEAEPLLPELLSEFDIVMLKTPTEPFSPEEIDALVEFVRQGGGLWMLGDHTNVFGTSTYFNKLITHFGLRLRYDSTYDIRTMGLSLFRRPSIFPHPAVAFMPPFLFATSCTMESPYFSENMMLGYGLKAMELDYSQTSFFPRKDSRNYAFGVFVQQGGVKFGRGRVALFTDSTCLSNFFMFIPGKPELSLGTVQWLNRTNRYAWANKLLPVIGLAALVAAGFLMRRRPGAERLIIALSAGFLGLTLAVAIYDSYTRASYALPEPHADFVSVAFDGEHAGFNLPTRGLTKFPETSLHTFFVWTQRIGLFPSLEPTLEEALQKGDVVVIARPLKSLDQAETDALLEYVESGGRLLLIVDGAEPRGPTAQVLDLFGLKLDYEAGRGGEAEEQREAERRDEEQLGEEQPGEEQPDEEGPGEEEPVEQQPEREERPFIVTAGGVKIVPVAEPTGIIGGKPLLFTSDGRTVLAEVRLGEGKVYVFSDFYLLTTEIMGHTGITPNARQRSISELEYYMLRELLDMPQPRAYWE